MIIVVAAEKGGVGKSTNAITIACRIKLDGADVVLVDTDTSATAIGWSDIRVQNKIEPPIQVTQNLRQPLPAVIDFAEKYDAVVCDLGAGDYAKMRDLALAADLFLVPTPGVDGPAVRGRSVPGWAPQARARALGGRDERHPSSMEQHRGRRGTCRS